MSSSQPAGPNMNVNARHGTTSRCGIARSRGMPAINGQLGPDREAGIALYERSEPLIRASLT